MRIHKDKKLTDRPIWIDIVKQDIETISERFKLHPLTAEDLVHEGSRIKIEVFDTYMLCIFYTINENLELIERDFVLGKDFLITYNVPALDVKTSKPDEMMHKLIDRVVDNFFPVLERLEDHIHDLEEKAIHDPQPKLLEQILELKRKLVHIKRHTLQQREKLSFLAKQEYPFINKKTQPYFRDVYDHAIFVSDTVDGHREAASGAFDVYMSAVNNNMNQVMKIFSLIATVVLPLTVISGIYGTNFEKLPGAASPLGFWIMILGMIALSGIMIFLFRKRKWL